MNRIGGKPAGRFPGFQWVSVALGCSAIEITPTPEPSLSAVTGNPSPGFGFGFEAGNLFRMAARPDGHYVPFVPHPHRLGINPDALVRFGHARQYEPVPYRVNRLPE